MVGPQCFPTESGSEVRALVVSFLPARRAGQTPAAIGKLILGGQLHPCPRGRHHLHLQILSSTVFLGPSVNIISVYPHSESETNLSNHFPPGDLEALRSQEAFPKFQILP